MEKDTTTSSNIEDNLGMVQVIILMRIYDVLLVDLMARNPEAAVKISEFHENGEFVGPNPSVAPAGDDGESV